MRMQKYPSVLLNRKHKYYIAVQKISLNYYKVSLKMSLFYS